MICLVLTIFLFLILFSSLLNEKLQNLFYFIGRVNQGGFLPNNEAGANRNYLWKAAAQGSESDLEEAEETVKNLTKDFPVSHLCIFAFY